MHEANVLPDSLTPTESAHTVERIEAAAEIVRARFSRRPDVAIVLGTGLGGLAGLAHGRPRTVPARARH